jgi:hypothetical protein
MSDKKSITFRCEADILEALDNLGRERYHVKTPHRYDRSKILMDILRWRGDNAAETFMGKALRLLNLQKDISDYD